MFLWILLSFLALAIVYFFLQFRLAKKLGHAHPWFAFFPFLNLIQLFQMGKISSRWIFINLVPVVGGFVFFYFLGKAYFNISERAGERRLFGLLHFVPFVNYWAIWKLLKNKQIFVEDPAEAQIVQEIVMGLREKVSLAEIRNEALAQGVTKEDFEVAAHKAQVGIGLDASITNDSGGVTRRGVIWLLFFLGMGPLLALSVIGFLFPSSEPSLSTKPSLSTNSGTASFSFNIGGIDTKSPTEDMPFEKTNPKDIEVIFPVIPEQVQIEQFGKKKDIWVYDYSLKNKKNGKLLVKAERSSPRGGGGGSWSFEGKEEEAEGAFSPRQYSEFEIAPIPFKKPVYGQSSLKLEFYDCFEVEGDCENHITDNKIEPIKVFQRKFLYEEGFEFPKDITNSEKSADTPRQKPRVKLNGSSTE
jgi:hypothetical protein